jgi:CRISPR/Cas system-associated endoribonuclease Cas2
MADAALYYWQRSVFVGEVKIKQFRNYEHRYNPYKYEYKKIYKFETISIIIFITASSFFVTIFLIVQS